MKKFLLVMITFLLISVLSSCTQNGSTGVTDAATAEITETTTAETTEETNMKKMTVTVGDHEYTATLYDNETAAEFAGRLPLTVDMQELHGNEKYYYFDRVLPAAATVPDSIEIGDIKLFGSDCLVLFYESFTTSYSYTDIGKIENPDGLKEALGNGNASVSFAVKA